MNKVLVCPPVYNEKVKVKSVIERFLNSSVYQKVDYLIIDDASDDGTTEIVQSYAARGVKTVRHAEHKGVGGAVRTAIEYALEHRYEVLVIMAGNDKDNPDEISAVIDPILTGGFDFVQGSRYLQGNQSMGAMPYYRRIATQLHPWLMSLIIGTKVTDSTNGFRAIRVSILSDPRIDWRQPWLKGYELEPYLLYKAIVLKYRFKEVAVTKIYPPKKLGYTKMRPLLGWWSILRPLVFLGLGIRK